MGFLKKKKQFFMSFKRSSILKLLIISIVASTTFYPIQTHAATYNQFIDIDSVNSWAGDSISYLVDKGVIQGDGKGHFTPYGNLTRGEAAKILSLSLNLSVDLKAFTNFEDTRNHWSSPYVKALQDYNPAIIKGYNSSEFKPNNFITRQEMAKMIVVAYNLVLNQNAEINFLDNNSWGKDEVAILASLGIVQGKEIGYFSPDAFITRAESTVFVHRTELEEVRLFVPEIFPTIPAEPEVEENLVNGNIKENSVWTTENSPYVVNDDLQIFDNVKLTIEPGTVIKTHEGVAIKIAGSIESLGTNESPVIFTSYADTWKGLEFINSSSTIRNSILENASRAISLTGSSQVYMDGNIFSNNYSVISDMYGYEEMGFINNTVIDNHEVFSGIRLTGKSAIQKNNFINNGKVFPYGYYFGEITVTENNFINNSFVVVAPTEGYGYGSMDFTNNWWGTTDENIISTYIRDKNTDVSLQVLEYLPFKLNEIKYIGSKISYEK